MWKWISTWLDEIEINLHLRWGSDWEISMLELGAGLWKMDITVIGRREEEGNIQRNTELKMLLLQLHGSQVLKPKNLTEPISCSFWSSLFLNTFLMICQYLSWTICEQSKKKSLVSYFCLWDSHWDYNWRCESVCLYFLDQISVVLCQYFFCFLPHIVLSRYSSNMCWVEKSLIFTKLYMKVIIK